MPLTDNAEGEDIVFSRLEKEWHLAFSESASLELRLMIKTKDTDVKYPNYTPQMGKSGNNNVLRAGNDKTLLHPAKVLWVKTTAPDNQSVSNSGYDTVASSDLAFKTTKTI